MMYLLRMAIRHICPQEGCFDSNCSLTNALPCHPFHNKGHKICCWNEAVGGVLSSLQSADLLNTRDCTVCKCTVPVIPCKQLCTLMCCALQK